MKKLTKVLAIILCMAMMFTLCACGKSDTEKFIGTWEAEADMTDNVMEVFNALLKSYENDLGDADVVIDYFDFGKMVSVVTFTLNEDGTYEMKMALTDESLEEYKTALKKGLKDLFTDSFVELAEMLGMSMEEFEAAYREEYGSNLETDINFTVGSTLAQFDIQSMFADTTVKGKWKAEDGKLFMTEDVDDDFEDGSYDVYEALTEDGFKLVEGYTDGDEDDAGLYPLSFTRVK